MTSGQKQELRNDRQQMSAMDVARKWGLTRQRVYQIVNEQPDPAAVCKEFVRAMPAAQPVDLVHFKQAKLQHLNDPNLQKAIRDFEGHDAAAACHFNASAYAVQSIRRVQARKAGRPKSREASSVRAERQRERHRQWRKDNAALVAEYDRAYRQRHPEKCAEASRANYQKHRDARLAVTRKRYLEYRPEDVAARQAWKARNPEKVREQRARWKERQRTAASDLTESSGGMR